MIIYGNMRYEDFLTVIQKYPLFGDEVLLSLGETPSNCRLQLTRWAQKGKVLRLKRGLYTLPAHLSKIPFSLRWLANTLYSPSYISLEYALSLYDLIPERVHPVTSVTLLKTAKFSNPLGIFAYRHIKKELFFGFTETKDEHQRLILTATPEKALLDYVYYFPRWQSTSEFLEESIRLQGLENLSKKWLRKYADRFQSKKIAGAAQLFLKRM